MLRPSRADRSGLRTCQPRIAVAQAPAAATSAPDAQELGGAVEVEAEPGGGTRPGRRGWTAGSERAELPTRSKAVRSTITEANMTMLDARVAWGGRRRWAGSRTDRPESSPNPQHPRPSRPRLRAVLSGSFSGLVRPISPMCATAPTRGLTDDQRRVRHKAVRPLHGRRRRVLHGRHGPGHRLPRPLRCRQVHLDARHGPPHPRHHRPRDDLRPRLPRLVDPGLEVGVLLDASAQHAGWTVARSSPSRSTDGPAEDAGPRDPRRVGQTEDGRRRVRDYSSACASASASPPPSSATPRCSPRRPANGLYPAGIRWMRNLLRGFANDGGPRSCPRTCSTRSGHRRRRRHRPGPHRGAGSKSELLAAAGTLSAPLTSTPCPCPARAAAVPSRSTAACASTPTPTSWARPSIARASSCASSAAPTEQGSRRCSSSSPPSSP